MPNMAGTGLVSKLRRLDGYENTPIVMVTTESDGYKKDKLKSLGANGWLRKPFTEEQVTNVLKHFLK
jgi:two-component system chemotaxis response regulator CheY